MRTKKGFNLRSVCGEQIIVAEGIENIDFSKIIRMNESSAYLWNAIKDKDFSVDDLAQLLSDEYDVDMETVLKDAASIVEQWKQAGIVE